MNGAQALIKTLLNGGIEVCFANPGISEMQLVQAIDQIPGIRPILVLFEGVATGADACRQCLERVAGGLPAPACAHSADADRPAAAPLGAGRSRGESAAPSSPAGLAAGRRGRARHDTLADRLAPLMPRHSRCSRRWAWARRLGVSARR
ncbi:MAG: hypothetical protein CRU78_08745 [Candidatus Accumulibacter phosphatis]|uniref:Thiamine pyrophosphate enzyme N-terminal TPP-binding domain-containing protein n=1 Tax=Candidatus Accumulibacter phosphatis TaxID=327160 RepID=A0A6A7RSP6_9PROT|nr:hypothetical protein [Candidatus Accumulibacter phosphatis]